MDETEVKNLDTVFDEAIKRINAKCENCMFWGRDENDTFDETGKYRYCWHELWSGQDSLMTRAYDDMGNTTILVHKDFGCILFEPDLTIPPAHK